MGNRFVSTIEEKTLNRIELESPRGLTSREILALFKEHGMALSEATLRKYVQLGLLPRSVRVGQKGKHQGSKGLYPVRVVRQILWVKSLLAQDYTIEQIQREVLFLRGEIEQMEETLGGIFTKLSEAVAEEGRAVAQSLLREVKSAEGVGRDLLLRLRTIESRLVAERRGSQAVGFNQEVQGAVG
jgi:hypothetical protein